MQHASTLFCPDSLTHVGCERHIVAKASSPSAFTLVEMLAVIAIIGLLTALAIPSLPSLIGAKGISKGVGDTAGILEMARTEAMARKTYVWVSFLNRDISGTSEILIGAVSSLDGSTDSSSPNLRPLTKVIRIPNLVRSASVPSNVPPRAADRSFIASKGPGFVVGNVTFPSDDTAPTVIFSPNGEILPSAGSLNFLPKADIGLVPTKGTFVQSDGSDGAIVRIVGASGRIQIFRP